MNTSPSNRPSFILKSLLISIVCVFFFQANASNRQIESAKNLFQAKQYKKAHEKLNEIPMGEVDPKRMALVEFFRGVIFFEQSNFNYAIRYLDKSIQLGTRLSDVAHFYKGLAYLKLSNNGEAQKAFKKVDHLESSDFLKEKSKFHLAEILFESQNYREALVLFKKLERKMRRTEVYPDILWALLKINHHNKKRLDACYWGRKLYKKYPNYEPVAHWGLRWDDNLVDGTPLKCKDTIEDQKARIKRLQWMGASEKAFEELKTFQKTDADKFTKDLVMSEYLINEGMVREAFNRLKVYYKDKEKKKDFDYISLFAKAASRAGEYQAAVGIYMDAYKRFKGGDSRSALYRAAFLSYQNQDYDGALRRFGILTKKFSFTSLGRQANWYVPWIYYLKGNYQVSFNLFKKALKNRRRMLPRSVTEAKLKYWMAMSMYKLGNKKVAQELFLDVSHDEYIGYYSIAAVQRLRGLIGSRALASIEHTKALTLHENWLPHFSSVEVASDSVDFDQTTVEKTNEAFLSDWEKLPFMREYLDMSKPTQIFATVSAPEFRKHIERAKELAAIGMAELAKWELYSIEGRTKNKDYLKTLMFEYHRNGVYHRAAYIGTRHFAGVRTHLGLHLGAPIWRFVYPRAFEPQVLKSGKGFGVAPEFVWSIMKAETNFRPDALSPVGARGLMQVMTHTGRKVASMIGKSIQGPDLFKPDVGVEIGTRYLKRNLKKFKGKIPLAAAAYNGGPHRVHQWLHQFGHLEMDEFIEHIPFLETRNYVKKVTRYYTLYNLLYNKKADASSWLAENVDVHLEGTPPTRETWEVL